MVFLRQADGRPQVRGAQLGTALFALMLLAGMGLGLLGGAWAVAVMVHDAGVVRDLVARGVMEPGERLEAWHDHSPARDGSAGCAVVEGRLARWGDAGVVDVTLLGAEVEPSRLAVEVRGADAAVTCALEGDEGGRAFAALVAERAREALPPAPRWQPTDPRLRRHFGLDDGEPAAEEEAAGAQR